MSKLLKSKFLVGIMLVAVLAVGAFALATTASAQQAIITVSDVQYAATVQLGSSGQAALIWQRFLNGYSTTAQLVEDGKFGPLSVAQAKAWQSSRGLSADGVLGAMSRAAAMAQISMNAPASAFAAGCTSYSGYSTSTGLSCAQNIPASYPACCSSNSGFSVTTGQSCAVSTSLPAGCSSTVGYSSTTGAKCDGGSTASGPLAGGAGDITISALSTYGDEQVGEDEEDVKVLAFEIEADDESDIDITSVKVELNQQDATNSEDMNDYMTSVSVWMGSDKVGEADEDNFSESTGHVWSKSISLDGAVVRAGETEKFYLAISALPNMDSGDIDDDDWQIGISSVRFLDAEGVSSTDSLTLDIDDNVIDDTLEEEFDFASFATAADVELKAALNDSDDEINQGHVINVETGTTETSDVELLSFTLKADGSDVNIAEIPVILTAIDSALAVLDESTVFTSAKLMYGDEEVSTKDVVAGGITTFDDLDIDIADGETAEFKVVVDLQDLTGALDPGDQLKAELDATRVDLIDASDESGEDLATGDLTGTALGEYSSVYDSGIMLELVSVSKEKTHTADTTVDDEDQGTFKVVFDATAFDASMFIDFATEDDADANTAADDAGEGVDYEVYEDGANGTADDASYEVLSDILESSSTDTDDTATSFAIDEDTTRRFTLTVVLEPDTTGSADSNGTYELRLDSVNWGTVGDGTDANFYDFNLDEYKTGGLFLVENDV